MSSEIDTEEGMDEIALRELVQSLRTKLAEKEASWGMMKEQVRVSDEAFNFHLKRANELMEKCNQLEAESAVLREACECLVRLENPEKAIDLAEKALATNAGKSILLRLQEAEALLGESRVSGKYVGQDWLARRDAFLNPTTDKKG